MIGAPAFYQDRLYVPVSSLQLISRYSGGPPAEAPLHQGWVGSFSGALDQGQPGRYVNFLGSDGQDAARAAYPGATWNRLSTP